MPVVVRAALPKPGGELQAQLRGVHTKLRGHSDFTKLVIYFMEPARGTEGHSMAKYSRFDPPGNNTDLSGDPTLPGKWSDHMANVFDVSVASVNAYLHQHGGGVCQLYNPVSGGRPDPDLPASATDIPWNGFPKRHGSPGPGQEPDYAGAEAPIPAGSNRDQDEYLEWFVNKKNDKIISVHFTCEAYDYFQFLAGVAPQKVLDLYHTFISPSVQMADLLGEDGTYDPLNRWNTELGAMHLTHPANNLFAEVFLAASATVRRSKNGVELTASIPLIQCAQYGDASRNSDPAIGAAVNGLARQGRHITIANPVGLYMASFNGSGLTITGQPAGGFFKVIRGAFPLALRAVYELPADLASQGLTVSDVLIGGKAIQFGGQLAERITMHIAGIASVATDIHNSPVAKCGGVPQVKLPSHVHTPFAAGLALAPRA